MAPAASILAVGDCNTLGTGALVGHCYPELVAGHLRTDVSNKGLSMATSREGCRLLHDHLSTGHALILIQFGLADAYLTSRHIPYVLYYPDNPLRSLCRHLIKQLKKFTRRRGLNRILGEANVVPLAEYRKNIEGMIDLCGTRKVLLLETIPHHHAWRNPHIERYNAELAAIAAARPHCRLILTYNCFAANLEHCYSDTTHANALGHRMIANAIIDALSTPS